MLIYYRKRNVFSCGLCDIFLYFQHCFGGKGDGSSSIRENKWEIEKPSAKCWVFQVILEVIVGKSKKAISSIFGGGGGNAGITIEILVEILGITFVALLNVYINEQDMG